MSKYSHYEMSEKIFGSRYKFNDAKELVPYSRTDMWDKLIEQQNKISDLEAKLAESEKLKENYDILRCQHKRLGEFCDELKQQLAEKEKEINDWKDGTIIYKWTDAENKVKDLEQQLAEKDAELERISEINLYNKDLADTTLKQLIDKENELIGRKKLCDLRYEQLKQVHQDKISFAVEQLEQLRHDIWTNQADDGYTDMQVDLYELNDVIDVRIMQIKEGK